MWGSGKGGGQGEAATAGGRSCNTTVAMQPPTHTDTARAALTAVLLRRLARDGERRATSGPVVRGRGGAREERDRTRGVRARRVEKSGHCRLQLQTCCSGEQRAQRAPKRCAAAAASAAPLLLHSPLSALDLHDRDTNVSHLLTSPRAPTGPRASICRDRGRRKREEGLRKSWGFLQGLLSLTGSPKHTRNTSC